MITIFINSLKLQVTKLLEELREAKESQSPEMKHFLCLEKKIKHIETRRAEREQEIQKVHLHLLLNSNLLV